MSGTLSATNVCFRVGSSEALSGANVQLGERKMATDEGGRFRFSLVEGPEGVISVSHVGYRVYRAGIRMDGDLAWKSP